MKSLTSPTCVHLGSCLAIVHMYDWLVSPPFKAFTSTICTSLSCVASPGIHHVDNCGNCTALLRLSSCWADDFPGVPLNVYTRLWSTSLFLLLLLLAYFPLLFLPTTPTFILLPSQLPLPCLYMFLASLFHSSPSVPPSLAFPHTLPFLPLSPSLAPHLCRCWQPI